MIELCEYSEIYLDKSWDWLNDPEIKKLTLTPDFTKEDQQKFYKSIPSRTNFWIKGISYNSIPIGVVGLKNITLKDAEFWCYIGEKEYWGRGLGKVILQKTLEHCVALHIQSVYLKIDKPNIRSKKLYLNNGFTLTTPGEIEVYTLDLIKIKS